jgi:uncharacterized protein (TIGR02145 family)
MQIADLLYNIFQNNVNMQNTIIYNSLLSGYDIFDIDGNGYNVVTIGSQQWTVQNLRTTHYSDNTSIPRIDASTSWFADTTGAYCEFDNSIGLYVKTYGYLYSWYAATNVHNLAYFTRGGVQETGWRVPSRTDFNTLSANTGTDASAGNHLKESGTLHWASPNAGADNTSGFTGIAAAGRVSVVNDYLGYRPGVGYFLMHTTNQYNSTLSYFRYMYSADTTFQETYEIKSGGVSVRCVRDI